MKSFITGYPRCRSAFLATMFTWKDSLFFHDTYIYDLDNPSPERRNLLHSISHWMMRYGHLHLGISDPHILLHWRELLTAFPNAKWIMVKRKSDDAFRSCLNVEPDFSNDAIMEYVGAWNDAIMNVRPMIIDFDKITPDECFDMAEYLGIDIGPRARVKQLCDMNIQIHPPILKRRLENLKVSTKFDMSKAA